MTRFLASVRDALEAEIALGACADIIDLKDPAQGALGAPDPKTLVETVRRVAGRAELSATIGDLPMHGTVLRDAVLTMAASGVDYIKLGLFPGGDGRGCLDMLADRAPGMGLIFVLFADAWPDFDGLEAAAEIGAHGVMLDTAGKDGRSLLDHLTVAALSRFVASARARGLIVGLAGSLKPNHVAALLPLEPDLLGFRGALCRGGARGGPLDPAACAHLRALIPEAQGDLRKVQLTGASARALY